MDCQTTASGKIDLTELRFNSSQFPVFYHFSPHRFEVIDLSGRTWTQSITAWYVNYFS